MYVTSEAIWHAVRFRIASMLFALLVSGVGLGLLLGIWLAETGKCP